MDAADVSLVCLPTAPEFTSFMWQPPTNLDVSPGAVCRCEKDPDSGVSMGWCTSKHQDAGRFCSTPEMDNWQGGMLEAGKPVYVHVLRPGCLSGSCSRDIKASCTVERSGNALTVHSSFSATEPMYADCTLDCLVPIATCVTEPLPAGTYTLTQNGVVETLTIPSKVDSCSL